MNLTQPLIFVCAGTSCKDEKISHKLADRLEYLGLAKRGNLKELSSITNPDQRMIFLNDCKSACIRLLAADYPQARFLDVRGLTGTLDELIAEYVRPLLTGSTQLA